MGWKKAFEYRFNTTIKALRYFMTVVMYGFVWYQVALLNPAINPESLVSYFAVASVLYGLSNYHLDELEIDIRLGHIAKFLLKPMSAYWYYFSTILAEITFEVFLKILFLIPVAWVFNQYLVLTPVRIAWFLAYLPVIALTTFSFYCIATFTAFWFNQVYAFRLTLVNIQRFLSGVFIPLQFFPPALLQLVLFLPFASFVFVPIKTVTDPNWQIAQTQHHFMILVVWLVIFAIGQRLVWNRATHSFESTGI